jgi:hypothetical protein
MMYRTQMRRLSVAVLCSTIAFATEARGQSVQWNGITWTNLYPSNSILVNGAGNLEVKTGDATVGNYGGALHPLPLSIHNAPEAWIEATFSDTNTTPGPQINGVLFDTSTSAYVAALGANDTQTRYTAHWRRENPTGTVVSSVTVDIGPRTPGSHTVRIGRLADGRLQYWLDNAVVMTTPTSVFPANVDYAYLVAKGNAQNQTATFTGYREGSVACVDALTASFSAGTLTLTFNLMTSVPATWTTSLTFPASASLWSVSIPAISPAASFSVPIPGIPALGTIGVQTTLNTAAGTICWDSKAVSTGP